MTNAVATIERKSILASMASKYQMEPAAFEQVLRNTVAKPGRDGREISREEFAACLVVANQYNLNPLTKEIYFFPDPKRGGVVPVVGVDGWARIINEHPQFDGMDFTFELDERGRPISAKCQMHRKDRNHPVSVIEYFDECSRETDPWRKSPKRMLRHKVMIQAARYAFGFSGIYDQDDADAIIDGAGNKNTARSLPSKMPPRNPQQPQKLVEIPAHMIESEPSDFVVWDEPEEMPKVEQAEIPVLDATSPLLDKAREKAMGGMKALKLWRGKLSQEEAAAIDQHIETLEWVAKQADENGETK